MKFKPFQCGLCNAPVQLAQGPGRTREYRRGVALPVPANFAIPTCTACGEEYLSVDRAESLDVLQAPAYATWQKEHFTKVVDSIRTRHGVTLRQVESACDVTPTYLSHVLAGRKEASTTLLCLLEAYSLHPDEFARRRSGESWEVAHARLFATLTSASTATPWTAGSAKPKARPAVGPRYVSQQLLTGPAANDIVAA